MDLISYLMKYLQGQGTSVVPRPSGSVAVPGRSGVPYQPNIIDGEWSEVPKMLSGPAGALARRGVSSLASSAGLPAVAEATGGPMAALIAAGDGRPNNSLSDIQALTQELAKARAARLANASPSGQVTSQPMPPVSSPVAPLSVHPNSLIGRIMGGAAAQPPAPSAAGPTPPSGPLSGDEPDAAGPTPQATPSPPGASTIPWWANATGANFGGGGGGVPMPQPRPQIAPPQATQANPMMSSSGPIPGAVGPTSTGGAPLQPPQQQQPAANPYSSWNGLQFGPNGELITPQDPPNGSNLIQKMLGLLTNQANSGSQS